MTAQKALSLEQYHEGFENYMFEQYWQPLDLIRIDMPDNGKYNATYFKEQGERVWKYHNGTAITVYEQPIFIRACPLEARHGVLESAPATSLKECINIVRRIGRTMLGANPHDPEGEPAPMEPKGCIIVQKYIEADASAVLNPGMHMHIAGGIDGITAGTTGTSVAIPMRATGWEESMYSLLNFNDKNRLQVEFVSKLTDKRDTPLDTMRNKQINHNTYITQLRGTSGNLPITPPPKGVTINGFIPSEGKCVSEAGVSNVVDDIYFLSKDVDEIAAMEAFMQRGWDKGTVVSHPTGTLSSHAAMECGKFQVPYIVAPVELGQVWTQAAVGWVTDEVGYEPVPYDPYDYIEAFMEGLSVGLYHWARQYGWLSTQFHQLLAPIHNPEETTFLAGAFVGWLVNGITATAIGEMRHSKAKRRNTTPDVYATLSAVYDGEWEMTGVVPHSSDTVEVVSIPYNRQHFYYNIEKKPMSLETLELSLTWLDKMYRNNWGSGYGGTNYANSCKLGLELVQSIQTLVSGINKDNFLDVVGKANAAEHAVHNNGYFFNKFMSKVAFDMGTAKGGWKSHYVTQAFNVFYAADAALSMRGVKIPKVQDSIEVLKYSLEHGHSYWRKNPIAVDDKAPKQIREAIDGLFKQGEGHVLHTGGGDLINYNDEKFVPCGHDDCSHCETWRSNLENIKIAKAKQELANVMGITLSDFIDTSFEIDMWLSNKPLLGQDDMTLKMCEKIHESGYEYGIVSLKQLETLFKSTTPEMESHAGVMKILTKYCHMNMDKMQSEIASMMDEEE